eukprot:5793561-Amphidinium_carterae.1
MESGSHEPSKDCGLQFEECHRVARVAAGSIGLIEEAQRRFPHGRPHGSGLPPTKELTGRPATHKKQNEQIKITDEQN